MKEFMNLISSVVITVLDLAVFLLAIDAGYSWLGLVCAIYIAVRFLAPDSRGLLQVFNTCNDSICKWIEDRKENKEMVDTTEVIEDI